MSQPVTADRTAREERWLWLLFAAAWIAHLGFSLAGWDNTLLNRLQFRQVQTAITTLFLAPDGFRFDYSTPLFGPPWSIPLELPVFESLVAWFARGSGLALDPAGRCVSWLFFQFSLPAFFLLLGSVGLRRPQRLIGLSLLVTSPIYLFFSRAFLIESTALCGCAWFLAAFARWLATGRPGWLAVAAVAGALGATVKVTTMVVFGVAAALVAAGHWWRARPRSGPSGAAVLTRAAAAMAVPALLGLAWLVYGTKVRSYNPDADILNTHFGFWSFGDVAQRLSASYWLRTIGVWGSGLSSEGGLVLGLYLLVRQRAGPTRQLVWAALAAFLSGQLIFSNLYYVHDYYFYASGVFLLLGLGVLLSAEWDDATRPAWGRWLLPLLVIGLQLATYTRNYFSEQRTNTEIPEYIRVIHDLTRPEDTIVVLGMDWDAAIPYYAQRRALMLRNGTERDPAGIARSLARLDPATVGAVVIIGGFREDTAFVDLAMSRLKLGPKPLLVSQSLQIGLWIPQARLPEVKDKLPPHTYATLDLVAERPPAGEVFSLGRRDIGQHREFDVLNPRPFRVTSMTGFSNTVVGTALMLNAHAPSEIVFHAPADARSVRATFGIHDGAYTNPAGRTDGVEFILLHRRTDGQERVLFSRLLDPANRAADQGPQQLEISLDPAAPGEIVFQTRPGPRNNASYDWAYCGEFAWR